MSAKRSRMGGMGCGCGAGCCMIGGAFSDSARGPLLDAYMVSNECMTFQKINKQKLLAFTFWPSTLAEEVLKLHLLRNMET